VIVVISFVDYVFEILALKRGQEVEMTFQGHSRSLQIALFDRSHTTSYYILTLKLYVFIFYLSDVSLVYTI